jgi:hypothetical protein
MNRGYRVFERAAVYVYHAGYHPTRIDADIEVLKARPD